MPGQKNRLAEEASLYLKQHEDNPVDWWPWGDDAFKEARRQNKPVLLSIGYSACHWCHVMAHESFEDQEVADAMNSDFICIKVDREERPDVDALYMSALHALGEQGGWPLTMFLDNDGSPIWGGTYFPKQAKYGRPGFLDILAALGRTWREDQGKIKHNKEVLLNHIEAQNLSSSKSATELPDFKLFLENILDLQDHENGGLKGAPKFPNAPILDALWAGWAGYGDERAKSAFQNTLSGLSLGGIYDHIGGGLARYSVDGRWLAPHFEKMLYDNAHFIRHLAKAYSLSQNNLFLIRIEETIGWLQREMTEPGGAFYASLDADSEGVEGKFYTWSEQEIAETLKGDYSYFSVSYDISSAGNWENVNIPNLLGADQAKVVDAIHECADQRLKLFRAREKRIRPGCDEKVLLDWNGLMIEALTEAARLCDRSEWRELAERAFHSLTESNRKDGRFIRCRGGGENVFIATASDLTSYANAALTLFENTGSQEFLDLGTEALEQLVADYVTEDGALYQSSSKATDLPVRMLAYTDEANPSAGSQAIRAFSRLSALTGDVSWHARGERLANQMSQSFAGSRYLQPGFMASIWWLTNAQTICLVGKQNELTAWADKIRATHHPARIMQATEDPESLPDSHPAKAAKGAKPPAALICENHTCSLPITELDTLMARLKQQ